MEKLIEYIIAGLNLDEDCSKHQSVAAQRKAEQMDQKNYLPEEAKGIEEPL